MLRSKLTARVLMSSIVMFGVTEEDESGHPTDTHDGKLARFLDEALVTGQLDHPGIVPVHDLGIDEAGRVFFTMKLVRGRNLKDIFKLVHDEAEGWTLVSVRVGVMRRPQHFYAPTVIASGQPVENHWVMRAPESEK